MAIKKNILLLSSEFPPQPGGIGEHASNVAKTLHDSGFRVHVLTNSRGKEIALEKAFDQGLPFQIHRVARYRFAPLTYLGRGFAFVKLLLQHPRCIVLASGKFSLWLGALGRLFFSRNVYLAIVHGTEINPAGSIPKWLTNNSLKAFQQLVAVSDFTKNLLLKTCPNAQVLVLNNGFNPSKFSPKSPQTPTPTLLSIGNLSQRKGQHNVVNALPLLQQEYPGIVYHIVGIPTEQVQVESLARQLGVQARVKIHGALDNQAVSKVLQGSDVLIQLSENTEDGDVEGFCIAILEANGAGLPAIGSIGCGIEDAIRDGFSGKLVDAHNPQMVLEALREILENYPSYAQNARSWAAEFTWEKRGQAYVQWIEQSNTTT